MSAIAVIADKTQLISMNKMVATPMFSKGDVAKIWVKISRICEFRVTMGVLTGLLGRCLWSTLWLRDCFIPWALGCYTNNSHTAHLDLGQQNIKLFLQLFCHLTKRQCHKTSPYHKAYGPGGSVAHKNIEIFIKNDTASDTVQQIMTVKNYCVWCKYYVLSIRKQIHIWATLSWAGHWHGWQVLSDYVSCSWGVTVYL